jgi:hypothetical protein
MSGETTGVVRIVLRLEGLLVMLAAMLAYDRSGAGWGTFAWFFRGDLVQRGAFLHRSGRLFDRQPVIRYSIIVDGRHHLVRPYRF